ncbi:MAG: nuclear transport factor 2 family protein, partial [Solirubrobacteraceae bacterium]
AKEFEDRAPAPAGARSLLPACGTMQTMSQENVEIVRRGLEQFMATGRFAAADVAADFAWDMSNFQGWPEHQVYEGVAGAEAFLRDWSAAWDEWSIESQAMHDAGDKVVDVLCQRGRSKGAGMPVDMSFAMVWTLRDRKQTRMEMYSDPAEALKAVGLVE